MLTLSEEVYVVFYAPYEGPFFTFRSIILSWLLG
jgi:hypothetical protein